MPGRLEICLLGGVTITLDGAPLEFTTRKEVALLVYLACTGRPHTREAVAEQLWNERSAKQSRANLRTLLSRLRHSLDSFFIITQEQVALNPEGGAYRLDVADFTARLTAASLWRGQAEEMPRTAADKLAQALRLYQGDFLAGFHLRDAGGFEDWAELERERLRCQAEDGLRDLAQFYLQHNLYAEGIETATRLLALNPLDETARRQLMALLAVSGRSNDALAQYKEGQRVLDQELGVEPAAETQELYARISAGDIPYPAAGARLPQASAHNLPQPATPLIGRQDELDLLRQRLLNPSSRLVTITGIGGVGKTRLALAVAEQVAGDFSHGAWFVPLAGVGTGPGGGPAGERLVQAIAQAINLSFLPGSDPRAQLLEALRPKELLLILDNMEELHEAGVELILDLLQRAPYVTVLVTSRRHLNLQAEQALRIEGLPVPADGTDLLVGWDGCKDYPCSSVHLFVERASRMPSGFELNRENLAAVVQVCRLTEGLPLAIELAASWVEEMECAEIAAAIQASLDFLVTAQQDVPERHRSLRVVLESSWQMLSATEQYILVQAAVLGEFSQEAAASVTGATPGQLADLVSRSLLRRLGPKRYEVHALLRQLVEEKLARQPSLLPEGSKEMRARHCAYYLDFLMQREAALYGARPRQAVEEIRREMKNVREAWLWAVEEGLVGAIAGGSGALARFLRVAGLFREGDELFRRAAARLQALVQGAAAPGQSVEEALGWVLVEQAGFLINLAAYGQAAELAQQGVELAQRIQAADMESSGYLKWGTGLLLQGDYLAAREQMEKAVALAQEAGAGWLQAEGLRHLGRIESELGNYATARTCFEQAHDLFVQIGDRDGVGTALVSLSILAYDRADFGAARSYCEEALDIFQETGYGLGQVSSLANLGNVLMRLGDYAGAQVRYEQALHTLHGIGGRQGEGLLLNNLGNAVLLQGDNKAACEYALQAEALGRESGERRVGGYAHGLLGHALAGQGQFQAAAAAYRQALSLWEELGQVSHVMDPLAGLARVALAEGDFDQARQYVARILAYMGEAGSIPSTDDEEFLIYLICYQVLRAVQDPRAGEILSTAYNLLQERAAQIVDGEMRRLFLENVPVHREIVREWERSWSGL